MNLTKQELEESRKFFKSDTHPKPTLCKTLDATKSKGICQIFISRGSYNHSVEFEDVYGRTIVIDFDRKKRILHIELPDECQEFKSL